MVERDDSIIACAALIPFFEDDYGEIAALAVSPECHGQGKGDKLLGTNFFPYYQINLHFICHELT